MPIFKLTRREKLSEKVTSKTISDFGDQWTHFQRFDGYYGSVELLGDHFGHLMSVSEIAGKRVGEIGSGAGRVVAMLLDAGAREVVAVEPSEAFEVLKSNTQAHSDRIRYIRGRGEEIPAHLELDFIFAIGVLHHIPDPGPAVEAAYRALRPGGRLVAWLYGMEGNEKYLRVIEPLRKLTVRMPYGALNALSHALNLALDVYMALCKFVPLPVHKYCNHVLRKFDREKRRIVIYDQLNPAYSKYYTREEALDLFSNAGFREVRAFHRHGYSWTVVGERPGPGA